MARLVPSPSPYFVPGLLHALLIESRQAPRFFFFGGSLRDRVCLIRACLEVAYFVPGLLHVLHSESRQALISYQDHHMLLLTLAGLGDANVALLMRTSRSDGVTLKPSRPACPHITASWYSQRHRSMPGHSIAAVGALKRAACSSRRHARRNMCRILS